MEERELTIWETVLRVLWPVWMIVGKIFIIALIALGVYFIVWAAVRTVQKLKAEMDAFPGIAAVEFFGVLAGLIYLVPQVPCR